MIQAHLTRPWLSKDAHLEGPHVLELLVQADRSANELLNVLFLLKHEDCLVFSVVLRRVVSNLDRLQLSSH